jgi:CheY-like chemotaxis protein
LALLESFSDISYIKKAEDAKNESEAKSLFIANMNHEMRTPMNVVVGLTDLMLEEGEPENIKENLKKINAAGKTLLGLINDVLDISKIEAGKLELTPVSYDVASLVNDIITLNVIRIGEKPITFQLDISDELPSALYGDDLRVKQVANNLLSNAFKYTQKGYVTLGLSCERGKGEDIWMSIYVKDTGMGIRQSDLGKLFLDFNQLDTRANRNVEGTGLGLSITKKLVELMEGQISVKSEYGVGTTFQLRIRQGFTTDKSIGAETAKNLRSFGYSATKKQAHEKFVRPDLSYAKVLVVDDMETNLDVAMNMLRKYKMQVDCVRSGQDAIHRIELEEPVYNAIFMDHMMPGMDGVEATTKIRALGTEYARDVPIIALTANAIAGNEQMFLENGFQAFLSKPINIINLDLAVKRWVGDKPQDIPKE